jgi:DNA-binding CsgD family transcriptional regulator
MKQALIKQELDNTVLEKEALANKLNYKNAELKNSALYISQRNELIREFVKELEGWQSEMQKDNQGRFLRLLNKFQHSLDLNKEAQELNQAIEETNKDFFYNLLQQFPDLTENEKRLCAQIRLNLSIKDIASLNNISIKSAEMARYRLRKHFGLNHEDNLNEFLRKF